MFLYKGTARKRNLSEINSSRKISSFKVYIFIILIMLGQADQSSSFDMSPKLKILCLPGWRTSIKIMDFQLSKSKFRKNLQDFVEFEAINPIFDAQGPTYPNIEAIDKGGKFYQWWYIDPLEPRDYKGLDESAEYIYNYITENGPYDGLLGFSQGAALTNYMVALSNKDAKYKDLFKFVILVAGFPPRDTKFQDITEKFGPFSTPSLHIIGKEDDMSQYGRYSTNYYSNFILVEHEKGHIIPNLEGEFLNTTVSFLTKYGSINNSRL